VWKVAACERRASIAASFAAVAGLASLPVTSLSGSYRNRTSGQRIDRMRGYMVLSN